MASLSLATFPSEILALIAGYMSSTACLLKLWRSGDSLIRRKLSHGVTEQSLRFFNDTYFPRALLNLRRLRSLCLYSPTNIVTRHTDWHPLLRSLPETLEELSITSSDAETAFFNFVPDATSDSHVTTEFARGSSRLIDIGALFPRLHTLKVRNENPLVNMEIPPSDFPGFPSTLTSVSCGSLLDFSEPMIVFAKLPPSLVSWHVELRLRGPSLLDWSACPPSLTHIKEIVVLSSQFDFSWLPRTLRSVMLSKFNALFPPDPGMLRTLPSGLDRLDFWTEAGPLDDWSQYLPTGLQRLCLRNHFNFPRGMRHFPHQLTELMLTIHSEALTNLLSSDALPPSLQTLRIDVLLSGRPLTTEHLPPNLRVLSVKMRENAAEHPWSIVLKSLPYSLDTIDFQLYCANERFCVEGPLPKSLTIFRTTNSARNAVGWKVEDWTDACSAFPESLINIDTRISSFLMI